MKWWLLSLLALPGLAHADPATVIFTVGATAVTLGTAVTVAKYAIMIYGMYRGNRASRKAKDEAAAGLSARGYSIGSTDMPRSHLYGEREVDGRIVYVVEPKDEPKAFAGGSQPAQPKFYVVKALEIGHEIEGITDLLFDGKSVGPFVGDPSPTTSPVGTYLASPNNSTTGIPVAPGSEYYLSRTGMAMASGTVGVDGIISVPNVAITRVLSLAISDTGTALPAAGPHTPDIDPEDIYTTIASPNSLVSLGQVIVGTQYAGKPFDLVYEYAYNRPLVKAWFYRGTETQTVCQAVKVASGEQWNDNCRLLGTPYVVVEITPDLDKFPNGPPYITAIARGKRGLRLAGGPGYSRNPADHIYDYLLTECGLRVDELNIPMLQATRAACAETVSAGAIDNLEPRYSCDALLSTENDMLDNFRLLLGAMAGNAVYSGGSFDIRAGVPEVAAGSLDESDLASGAMEVVPFPELMDSFNSVKGRHPAKHRQYEITDYKLYPSATYIGQDQGEIQWEEIDQPCVTSGFQAQRIAKLLLHLNRNSQTFAAQWNSAAKRFSAGQVVNVNIAALGFTAKPYRIMTRKTTAHGTVELLMKEEPTAAYSHDYREDRDPDPAPNTTLEPVDFVEKPIIESVTTDASVAEYGPDGFVRPVARIKWARPKSFGIRHGGRIEVQYKFGGQLDWTEQALPGDAEKLDVTIQRSNVIAGRVRFMNAVQVYGDWTTFDKIADDSPTQPLPGNLLQNAEWELADPTDNVFTVGVDDFPGWRGPFRTNTETRAPVALLPYRGFSDWAATGFKTVGMVYWTLQGDGAAWPHTTIKSKPIAVSATRMLLSFRSWNQYCTTNAEVHFYDAAGAEVFLVGEQQYTLDVEDSILKYPNQVPRLEIFDRAHRFMNTPADARTAVVHLNVQRRFQSDGSPLPSTFWHYAIFTQPFLSAASPGQVSHPAWSK